ncbi:hypothetical protein ACI2IP_08545 [Microbacterium sp. NPDC090218]
MDKPLTTLAVDLEPIDLDWTIAELITWLSHDSRQHDPALQHPLAMIEAALTGEPWTRPPSTVALIRSIVDTARTGGLHDRRIAQLIRTAETPEPDARFARMPQVA